MAEHKAHLPDIRESDANANGPHGLAGGMGVSSEITGPVGDDGEEATHGVRSTAPREPRDDDPPESRPGNEETNPVGITPKAMPPKKPR